MLSNLQETADLVTFTKEILNGKLHFLCSDNDYASKRIYECIPLSTQLDLFCPGKIEKFNFLE